MTDYQSFLASKRPRALAVGISDPPDINPAMFDFQAECVDFALRQGRCGLYLDTGLGKTFCQLEWADKAMRASNGYALILTPLAVARQMEREAHARGYDARVIREQAEAKPGINICNYDRMDLIEADRFGVVSLDEASILKNFSGKTTRALIEAFRDHRFKMAATATPAPNDHMELGQQSEFLSAMTGNEMLSRFFINDASTASQTWRLKKHAETEFWSWMASWARMAQSPEDLGFDGSRFVLPELKVIRHRAAGSTIKHSGDDLFGRDISATNMFDMKRQTSAARARMAVDIVFGDLWRRIRNTRAPTTSPTEISGNEVPSSGMPTTRDVEKNTRPTRLTKPTSAKALSGRPEKTRTVTNPGNSGSPLVSNTKIIEPCSLDKTELVQSAGREAQDGHSISTSTTATTPAPCGDYSANHAILASESSATILKASSGPPPTSEAQTPQSWVLWCDTNDEQDALEREFGAAAFSIRGSQSPDEKEALHEAWLGGARPVLITKSSIFGYGMNWQHCCRMIFVGRSFSYEAWYQAVRRCWRFGQTKPVEAHIIVAEGEDQIGRVIDRKAGEHSSMKRAMAAAMRRATTQKTRRLVDYAPKHNGRMPTWL